MAEECRAAWTGPEFEEETFLKALPSPMRVGTNPEILLLTFA